MKISKNKLGLKMFAVIWLVFIFGSALMNLNLFAGSLTATYNDGLGFKSFIEQVKTAYTSDLKLKTAYINLNGLFAKLTGRTVYNDVAVLNNGMLVNGAVGKIEMEPLADSVADFKEYLSDRGIKFLYVQAPYKLDLNNELLPTGVVNNSNINADNMVESLKNKNVEVLDLRKYISKDVESIEKYYYYTDHHWNNQGAFLAFQKIIEKVDEIFYGVDFNSDFLDENKWKKEVYDDILLGSLGQRVGQYYSGVDDVTFYTPEIDLTMAMYVNKYFTYYSGNFSDVNIRKGNIVKDYFNITPYAAYIGGNHPIVKHYNFDSTTDLKVLFIKDSYGLPVSAFMSTVFGRMDSLDPRYLTSYTISEYVECYNPDIVIQMVTPSVFTNESIFDYKTEDINKFKNQDPEIIVSHKKYNVTSDDKIEYSRFKTELKPETKYTFKFKDIEFLTSEDKRMTVALYNAETKEIIDSHIFDLEYSDADDLKEWTFITPEFIGDDLQFIIYAGEYKKIQQDKLTVIDAELLEYK